jgi:hypothetical protein
VAASCRSISRLCLPASSTARVLVGVVLLVLAVRGALRGQASRALILGCIGVMLIALARQLLFGDRTPAPINADALNLVASGVVIVAIAILLARRTLTPQRALAFAGMLILSALFAYRDLISDPLGAVLGFSGVALVPFGLTWDLYHGFDLGQRGEPPVSAPHPSTAGVDQLCAEHDGARVRGPDPRRQHHDLFRSLC